MDTFSLDPLVYSPYPPSSHRHRSDGMTLCTLIGIAVASVVLMSYLQNVCSSASYPKMRSIGSAMMGMRALMGGAGAKHIRPQAAHPDIKAGLGNAAVDGIVDGEKTEEEKKEAEADVRGYLGAQTWRSSSTPTGAATARP